MTGRHADDDDDRIARSLRSPPIHAQYPGSHLTIGAGVAIFHLATARVVLCRQRHRRHRHSRRGDDDDDDDGSYVYFLPKGRRDTHETSTLTAAEREGYEESGYRNRVLPLPVEHGQPTESPTTTTTTAAAAASYSREALWMQLLPLSRTRQYLLFWYAAETVPPDVEKEAETASAGHHGDGYCPPREFPADITLRERIAQDQLVDESGGTVGVYEPVRHENTGVDEEEAEYESMLLPIDEARRRVRGSVMEDVIRKGWAAVQLRMRMEQP